MQEGAINSWCQNEGKIGKNCRWMRILKRREHLHTKEIIPIYMRLPWLIVLHLDGCGLSGSGLRTGVKNQTFFEDLINVWPPKNSIQMFLIWYGEVTPWLSIFPQIVWNGCLLKPQLYTKWRTKIIWKC